MSEKDQTRRRGLWHLAENHIDPFMEIGNGVLPRSATEFILFFARKATMPFVLLLVVGGLAGLVEAATYWGLGWLIDTLGKADPRTLVAEYWPQLAGLLLLVLVIRTLVTIGAAIIEQQVIVPRFYALVRWQSFRRVIDQSYAFYTNDFAGRIATKVMQSGAATGDFIVSILQTLWSFASFLVLTATILGALDPWMAVVMAVWAIAYVTIARTLLPRLRAASRRMADKRSILNGRMVDAFTNIMAVKLFDAGRREHGFVREGVEELVDAATLQTRAITVVRAAVVSLNGVMVAAIGTLAVWGWMRGTISNGEIATTMGLVFRLNQMSSWMMFNISGLIRNYAMVQDSTGTISVMPEITDQPDAAELERVGGHVKFNDVTFHYGRGEGVIEAFNLEVAPGEHVGLVGPSGAGKTTHVNLLLRLYDVEGGKITLDGHDIREVTQASLRDQFGVVSQDPMLMHRSIRDNIAYGRPDASEEEIVAAAKKASAHDFIMGVADVKGRKGYDAHVGERGVKLSGGQRQRIAIARVFLKDAPVLVLDEATSALDSEIEAAIQENLFKLMEGKTVIAIAHRLSTIASLDRLVVMDEGRIVETGSHDELMKSGGLYARLWERQSGGFIASGGKSGGRPSRSRNEAAE